MTMPFSPSRTVFHGNGVATTFPFAFKVWSADQLTVTVTMPGATEQTEEDVTAQCSISLTESGGSVVYLREGSPLPAGAVLSITRDMPFVQEVDLVSASRFDPQVIEDALDQAAAERQQLREGLSRAVKLSATSATTPEDMVEDIFDARDQAEQSATGAAASATAAADSATAAASSATTASQEATAAADSADLASQKATAAAGSTANAATQADNAAGSATAAADSATAAASSATAAKDSEDQAFNYASQSLGSAGQAQNYAAQSLDYAGQSLSSAQAAAGSATTASQKAIAAADSATAAADSADLSRRWASEDVDVPVQSGEYSAKHYAHKAKDALPDNLVSRVEAVEGKTQSATTSTRGIGRIATAADALPGSTITNGPAFLDASTFKVSNIPTANTIPKANSNGKLTIAWIPSVFVGDIRLVPFRPEDLAVYCPGWYFCNGDQYALTSPAGTALNALHANYKTDWGITVSGSKISIPNLFYIDGRGFFLRAVDGSSRIVGSYQMDAFLEHSHPHGDHMGGAGGYAGGGASLTRYVSRATADPAGAEETRALNVGMTPAIFLNV